MTTKRSDGPANVWDTESQCIGMLTAGCGVHTEPFELRRIIKKIRKLISTRRQPKVIELEGIWDRGGSVRFRLPLSVTCSTGVAQMQIEHHQSHDGILPPKGSKLWLVRVYNDGLLVREFDVLKNAYTLALD